MQRTTFAILAMLATPAAAQTTITTTPLGGGWYDHTAHDQRGNVTTGSTMPLGGGWSTTTWHDSQGRTTQCSTTPLGGGFSTTNCH
jgi:hypothetical protein